MDGPWKRDAFEAEQCHQNTREIVTEKKRKCKIIA
jgi:hypothetical protein